MPTRGPTTAARATCGADGTGGHSDEPPPKPPLTKPTAAQLAEGRAKRLAYEEQRRRYMRAWHRRLAGLPDEPEEAPEQAQEPQPGKKRGSRARGMIHDPRQRRFDV